MPIVAVFVDSMTSISPFVGQLDWSDSQSAGQVEQPYGVWRTSKMKRPLL